MRAWLGSQLSAQTPQFCIMNEIIVTGVITVAAQRGPTFHRGRAEAVGPDDWELITLEHPIEPTPFRRRDVLGHTGPTPHLVPQMNEGGIYRALVDLVAGLREQEFLEFIRTDGISAFA